MINRIESSKAVSLCMKLNKVGFVARVINVFNNEYDKDYRFLCIVVNINKDVDREKIDLLREITSTESYSIQIGKWSTGELTFDIFKPWDFAEFVEAESVKYTRTLKPSQTVYTNEAWQDYYLNFIAV